DGSVINLSVIQTNASISPGNSGGGLFNMAGELIGIVNAKSDASGAEGLGFAIPINDAIDVAQDLLENGYVSGRPYLGITYVAVTDEATAQQLGVSTYGIYIVEVSAGSGAAAAGLEPGDRIVSIDGAEIASRDEDRKSTRLNSSHVSISYAVFCLKKKLRNISVNQHY